MQEMINFFAAGRDSPPIYRVSLKGLKKGEGQFIPGRDNKQY